MRYLFTLLLVLGISNNMYAQKQIKLTGVITDEFGKPLPSSNVIAFNLLSNKMESYGITNDKGLYRVSLKTGNNYRIRASFIGFVSDTLEINADNITDDIVRNIQLKEIENALNEVVLSTDIPIAIKGDSIVFHAEDFENGTEKKLGDILKKLPGVEVTEDGEIEVEGKTVQKVMVEGKDFFDGDSKLAVENIPSDAVTKIEVIKNFSEVGQLQNVTNNDDNIAINIKLKEGKKSFWFGDISAGLGLDERYLVHPKLFYYSPKKSINIITDVNNIGKIPFTRRDYFNFTGGFRNMHNSGTALNLSSDQLGFSLLQNNKAKEIEATFGALNFDYALTDHLALSGFFIYSNTKNWLEESKQTNYINNNLLEQSETNVYQNNSNALGKLSLEYKPKSSFQANYDVFGKWSNQSEQSGLNSMANNINNIINQDLENDPISIQQNAGMYLTRKNEDIISVQLQHYYTKENPFYNSIFSDLLTPESNLPFVSLFPYDLSQETYNLNQKRQVETNKLDFKTDYYQILNKKNNLTYSLGQIYSVQNYNTNIYQILDDTNIHSFDDTEFNNDVDYRFSDSYLGVSFRSLLGKFTVNPSLNLHYYNLQNTQSEIEISETKTFLSPKVFVNYAIKKSENLRFTYSKVAQFADIYSVSEGYILNNYNSIYRGNNSIEEGIYDTYQLSYNSFSFYNGTNVNANLTYTKQNNPIKNSLIFEGINAVSTSINSSLIDESVSTFGRLDKTFGKFKFRINSRLAFNNSYNVLNDDVVKSNSITQRHNISVQTTFSKGPNFELGYQHMVDDVENNNSANTYTTNRPYAKLETSILKNFILTADYSFYNFSDQNESLNTYSFMNADLYYRKPDSDWEYRLGVSNLLNTKSINSSSFNDNRATNSTYIVQPRYLFLTVKYNL